MRGKNAAATQSTRVFDMIYASILKLDLSVIVNR
jgi:hypothetical protein